MTASARPPSPPPPSGGDGAAAWSSRSGAAGAVVVGGVPARPGAAATAVAAPVVTAVDTTGAGDAFVGACSVALGAGWEPIARRAARLRRPAPSRCSGPAPSRPSRRATSSRSAGAPDRPEVLHHRQVQCRAPACVVPIRHSQSLRMTQTDGAVRLRQGAGSIRAHDWPPRRRLTVRPASIAATTSGHRSRSVDDSTSNVPWDRTATRTSSAAASRASCPPDRRPPRSRRRRSANRSPVTRRGPPRR